jgi:hypothetical protein
MVGITLSRLSRRERKVALLGLDHLAARVVAAIWADRVLAPGLLAVWTRLELDEREGQVRTAAALPGFGLLDLG